MSDSASKLGESNRPLSVLRREGQYLSGSEDPPIWNCFNAEAHGLEI